MRFISLSAGLPWALFLLAALGVFCAPPSWSLPEEGDGRGELILLSASWCPLCEVARDFLYHRKVAFRELDIEREALGRHLFRFSKRAGPPILLLKSNDRAEVVISGFNKEAWSKRLGQKGGLGE